MEELPEVKWKFDFWSIFFAILSLILFDLAIIPNTTISLLLSLIGLWAFLGLISNYTSAKTSAKGDVLGARLSLESEIEAYGHFLILPVAFHKTKKTGEILQKIYRGSWNLQHFIQMVSHILPSVIFLIFALAAMLIVKWQLGSIVLFTFFLYSAVTLKMTKPLLKSQENMHKSFEKEYGNVYDKLYNVFLIKGKNFLNRLLEGLFLHLRIVRKNRLNLNIFRE